MKINHFVILTQCIALLFRDTIAKKNLAKTVLPIFSTVRHSISVFLLYYTILYYNGKRMCTMSRTYAAQLRLASCFWGVAAVGNDGSERLSFWLSNIQASVCCYPHGSDFTRKLPIFLQQRFYNSVCLSWGLFRAL